MKKMVLISVAIAFIAGSPVFSQPSDFELGDLVTTMGAFSGKLARSLPFNSTMGLNWSDAHIGGFPRFGVGFSLGFTTMDDTSFDDLLGMFKISLPSFVSGFGGYPIPGYTVDARLGGFDRLDFGIKFGYLPIKPDDIEMDYLLTGCDIRVAIVKEKDNIPGISAGVGFNYMSGGLGRSIGQDITYEYGTNGDFITAGGDPQVAINWSTASLDLKAQISKTLLIFTPYIGFGASTGWSKAGYGVTAEVTGTDMEEAKAAFRSLGINLTDKGFSSETEIHGWAYRLFGGVSFSIARVRLDFTGFYNFKDNYGVTFGTRVHF